MLTIRQGMFFIVFQSDWWMKCFISDVRKILDLSPPCSFDPRRAHTRVCACAASVPATRRSRYCFHSVKSLSVNHQRAWPTFAGAQKRSGAEVLHQSDDFLKWPPRPSSSRVGWIIPRRAVRTMNCHCPSRGLWLCLPRISIHFELPWHSDAVAQPLVFIALLRITARLVAGSYYGSVARSDFQVPPTAHLWANAVSRLALCISQGLWNVS